MEMMMDWIEFMPTTVMNAVSTPSQSIQATKSYFHSSFLLLPPMFIHIPNYYDPFQLSAVYREYLELRP